MTWLVERIANRFFVNRAQIEARHLQRIASALAQDFSLPQFAELVVDECKKALSADATCIFMLQPDNHYELLAERGCTSSFKQEWKRIPQEMLPMLLSEHPKDYIFVGSTEDLKKQVPGATKLIEASGRKTIAYAPLVVNDKPIGIFGFSYNKTQSCPVDKTYISTLLGFCALALERVRLTELEQRARLQAEAANSAKTAFLANVSHEIRTPIGVIQGFVDLLLEASELTPTQRHWASVIRRNTQQLTGLIGEVLDISKIEAEKIEIEHIEFSLSELLEDVRTTAQFKAQEKGIRLFFETLGTPEWVRSDPTRLRQIMVNLVGNAIKFTMQGHVAVKISYSDDKKLHIEVVDSGVGISAENQDLIFEPFIQADTSTRRRFGGTGLGLTISRRLAQAMGGDVNLTESRLGEGSKFNFFIQCEVVKSPELALASTISKRNNMAGNHELAGLKILLVEDSLDNQDLICSLLSREGAQVDVADSGLAGVKKALAKNYNVVLMDIQMPGLDGHQAVTWLRSQGYDRPIAALTAHVLSSERQISLREGFDDYLTKPIDRKILIRSLKRLGFMGAG